MFFLYRKRVDDLADELSMEDDQVSLEAHSAELLTERRNFKQWPGFSKRAK
jgi:hypothetical protein